MTNYTRFMYFMIYWRPSFCMFVFVFCFFYSSALILLFRSSNIHITSKPHSTKCTDTVCTNIIPVWGWAAHSAAPFCSPESSYWHSKTYSVVTKIKTGLAFVTRKKERCFPMGEGKVVYGAVARTTPRCFTIILNTKSPLSLLQVWDPGALGKKHLPKSKDNHWQCTIHEALRVRLSL